MNDYVNNDYKVFELFSKQWALVTAGNTQHFNSCTISWGSMGTLWTKPTKSGSIITVYLHPSRYTCDFLKEYDSFTVSFFPQEYKEALSYMGSHSGRNEKKSGNAGLTAIPFGDSITYEEAELTFLCRKVYGHQLSKDDIAKDIQDYYRNNPKAYPVDENGQWQPHYLFIGEILEVSDKRK